MKDEKIKAGDAWLEYISHFSKLKELWDNIPEPLNCLLRQQIDVFAGKYPVQPSDKESTIPTAEEFYDDPKRDNILQIMIEFAKLHVQAALEAASKSNKFSYEGARGRVHYDVYPLSNIK